MKFKHFTILHKIRAVGSLWRVERGIGEQDGLLAGSALFCDPDMTLC